MSEEREEFDRGRCAKTMRFARTSATRARLGGDDVGYEGEVRCTAKETEVFETLLAVVEHFKLDVTLRVAGGLVRDKLVGRESDDIDVGLLQVNLNRHGHRVGDPATLLDAPSRLSRWC